MVADGNGVLKIPTNSKFITVINNTSYTVTVYGSVGTILDSNVEFEFPAFSALCYPVDTVAGELIYTIAWAGGSTADYFDVLLTDYNTNIYISFPQAGASNVSIVTDSVGLAKNTTVATLSAAVTATREFTYARALVDTQIKASAGFVHTLTFASDAVATAGTITLYDSLTEVGTKVFEYTVPASFVSPVTITLDVKMLTGIYLGFTTTADVQVTVSYK